MSRLAMLWRSGCGLLLAAVWTVLAADGPAPVPPPAAWDTATEAPAAFLQRLEQAGAGLAPAQRLTAQGAEAVVQAAAAAHVLGGTAPAKWGAKLYGADTDGRRTFDIVSEFMAGKYGRLIELAEAVGMFEREQHHSVRWPGIADNLEQAAGQDPARAGWRDAAVALRMLSLWRSGMSGEQRLAQLRLVAAAPDPLKRSLGDTIVNAPGATGDRARQAYYGLLNGALLEGGLRDPVLAELFTKIAPDPRAAAFAAQRLGPTAPAAAEAIARAQIAKTPDNPEALCQAASTLAMAGKRDEAIALLREAEGRFRYPSRGEVRLRLYGLLRGGRPTPAGAPPAAGPGMPPGPGQPGKVGDAALAEERVRRESAAGVAAPERAFAVADLLACSGDLRGAARLYAEAFAGEKDAAFRTAVWRAWSGCDPATAWASAAELDEALRAAGTTDEAQRTRGAFLGLATAAGIAAGHADEAVAWAVTRLPEITTTGAVAPLQSFLVLWEAAHGRPEKAAALALGSGNSAEVYTMIEALAECRSDRIPVSLAGGGRLDQACSDSLRQALAGVPTWSLAADLAAKAVPALKQARDADGIWQLILRTAPLPPKDAKDAAPAPPDPAQVRLREQLTQACLVRLDTAGKDLLAAQRLLEAAGAALQQENAALVLPQAQALFVGVLERAATHGLDANWAALRVRGYAEGLARCKASAELHEVAGAAVLKAFPDSPGVSQALAPPGGTPAAPAR